ncbi:exported hypothetical protein [Candidatus Glomeribacter gigasporarum BEG34]|uniref:Uncharacterized protein n=1 Tax=Candidatus Glomeribacter gigasporarum BEG34 TaxID=1070319 RepID=G2J8Z4_9BURK|nr:transglycosylase SLT domain-containing protein [Candidatus Glomeribacter gigasporarum]CCD29241.1 exported hypothetical protein [Candidatus Glomeribacter gigasporarum BEG34]
MMKAKMRRRILLCAAFLTSCGALALCAVAWRWQRALESLPAQSFDVQQYSAALRAGAGFQGRVARDEMGIVTLSGRCEDTAKLAPFLEQLEQSDIAYQNQTVCADELRRSVAWVLHRNGYPNARVESGATPDAVVITTAPDLGDPGDQRWFSVSRQLSQLPGLRAWKLNFSSGDKERARADAAPVVHDAAPGAASSASETKAGILSTLFRSASRISAWLGFPDHAGYWSIKALELSAQSIGEGYIAAVSQQYQIPLHLAQTVIWIESRGRHTDAQGRILTSPKGALGIMQLMPETARELKVNPFDVRDNIRGGFAYLAQLAHKYQRDWDKVIAAYNWGPRNIDEAVAQHGANWRIALPKESESYLLRMNRRIRRTI